MVTIKPRLSGMAQSIQQIALFRDCILMYKNYNHLKMYNETRGLVNNTVMCKKNNGP